MPITQDEVVPVSSMYFMNNSARVHGAIVCASKYVFFGLW